MTEAEFQDKVVSLADEYGVLWHHCPDSRRCKGQRGFPDLVLVGKQRVLFAELKSRWGKLSPKQTEFRYRTIAARTFYEVWKPADLISGYIEETLANL